ncbi:MAG: DUF4230 domain-containing protein [Bacteroidales bacterium]|jgi:hypothetical protein|nr:DUF4230 domain-containing protein [Bacteroidales bacterium]
MKAKITIILILLAAAGAVYALFKMGIIGKDKRVPVIEETPNIVEAVEQIQELCTEYYYDEVMVKDSVLKSGASRTLTDAANSAGNFFSNLFTKKESNAAEPSKKQIISQLEKELVVIVKVTCRVGFDLRQILEDDGMQVNGDTLFINLPKAQFLETIVNPTHLDIFAESGSWDFPQELQEVIKYAKMTVEQRAINDNILEKADKSGRKILECLFSTMGFKVIYTDDNATPAVYEPAEQLQ